MFEIVHNNLKNPFWGKIVIQARFMYLVVGKMEEVYGG